MSPPPRGRRSPIPDTPEARAALARLSNADAARHFGVSVPSVSRARVRLGVPAAKANPTRGPGTTRIIFTASGELAHALDAAAKDAGMSRAEWIRMVLQERLQ